MESACAVEGVFGGAGVQAGGQDGVFVAVGEGDREAPRSGGAAVAEAAEWNGLAVFEFAVDVSEVVAEAEPDSQ